MEVLRSAGAMRAWTRDQRQHGRRIGFVPTMGFLHEAHLSLVDRAKEAADVTVVSIFVNPTQFGPGEDFDSYPRDEAHDLALCEKRGVDAVWLPTPAEMYPDGYATFVDVKGLGDHLCGASRPGHFRGVTTIVSKLFNVVQPDVAVFGRKDAQQARILQRMTADLQFGIEIILGDTLREQDGLAMSSRNVRLSPEHRAQAPALYAALLDARNAVKQGTRDAGTLIQLVQERIAADAPAGEIDYVQVVDWDSLQPVTTVTAPALLALAVRFGSVRLIDNTNLEPTS